MAGARDNSARGAGHRALRAFTLLEIMLAIVIGGMVLTTALATFALLQRADRHNEARLDTARELSGAHRAVELTLRSMIMSNSRPPAPPPSTTPGAAPTREPAPSAEPEEPTEFERPRVILSAQGENRVMLWRDADGREVQLRPQRFELTVERPPVFAQPLAGETFQPIVHRMYASRRERDRAQRREERADERRTEEGEQDTGTFDETEPAIAPGVRGVFELTWEPDEPRRGAAPDPEGGAWALWWRTLPPLADTPDAERTEGLSDEEIDRNPMYRPVLLASGLRWCRWEAVRTGETLREFQSTWWEDLPAYVTLEMQTVTGKWSKWMFEVQGTRGAEPGSVIGQNEPPATPEATDASGENAGAPGNVEVESETIRRRLQFGGGNR